MNKTIALGLLGACLFSGGAVQATSDLCQRPLEGERKQVFPKPQVSIQINSGVHIWDGDSDEKINLEIRTPIANMELDIHQRAVNMFAFVVRNRRDEWYSLNLQKDKLNEFDNVRGVVVANLGGPNLMRTLEWLKIQENIEWVSFVGCSVDNKFLTTLTNIIQGKANLHTLYIFSEYGMFNAGEDVYVNFIQAASNCPALRNFRYEDMRNSGAASPEEYIHLASVLQQFLNRRDIAMRQHLDYRCFSARADMANGRMECRKILWEFGKKFSLMKELANTHQTPQKWVCQFGDAVNRGLAVQLLELLSAFYVAYDKCVTFIEPDVPHFRKFLCQLARSDWGQGGAVRSLQDAFGFVDQKGVMSRFFHVLNLKSWPEIQYREAGALKLELLNVFYYQDLVIFQDNDSLFSELKQRLLPIVCLSYAAEKQCSKTNRGKNLRKI